MRELQNVIERAVILCDDGDVLRIDEDGLAGCVPGAWSPTAAASAALTLEGTLAAQERELIESALFECAGRVAGPFGAAVRLGLPRQTLESKIERHGIDKRRFKLPLAAQPVSC